MYHKILAWVFVLNTTLMFAQNNNYHWPLVANDTNYDPIDHINSNFGDYRRPISGGPNRFHMGIDIQEEYDNDNDPNFNGEVYIHPVKDGRVCNIRSATTSTGNYTWFLVEHGDDLNTAYCNINNIHTEYLHLRETNSNISENALIETTDWLAPAWNMHLNHLHLNILTNYNEMDNNYDGVGINPLNQDWQEIQDGDIRPHDNSEENIFFDSPYIHFLYVRLIGAELADLQYPQEFTQIENNIGYTSIEFHGGTQNIPVWNATPYPYTKPRALITLTSGTPTMELILHATDYWNDNGSTPYSIDIYIDQHSPSGLFNSRYYTLTFDEIDLINNEMPNSNMVYNLESAITNLNTEANWYSQFYRLYGNSFNNNNQVLPNQEMNDPIDLNDTNMYGEEGMHKVEIILKSDRFREENGTNYIRNETSGAFYYYLLRNDNGYMDLAQSGTYN